MAHTEFVETEDEEGLVDLESEDLWLDESEGLSVNLDETFASLAVGDGGCGLLLAELRGLSVSRSRFCALFDVRIGHSGR